jgi:hypothetical protein
MMFGNSTKTTSERNRVPITEDAPLKQNIEWEIRITTAIQFLGHSIYREGIRVIFFRNNIKEIVKKLSPIVEIYIKI